MNNYIWRNREHALCAIKEMTSDDTGRVRYNFVNEKGEVMTVDEVWRHWTSHLNDRIFAIKNVIFNDPATIVFWDDGTKTVVKCGELDTYDPEKGLAMAISKRALGDKGNYYNVFKKWVPEEEEEDDGFSLSELFVKLGRTSNVIEKKLNELSNSLFVVRQNGEIGDLCDICKYETEFGDSNICSACIEGEDCYEEKDDNLKKCFCEKCKNILTKCCDECVTTPGFLTPSHYVEQEWCDKCTHFNLDDGRCKITGFDRVARKTCENFAPYEEDSKYNPVQMAYDILKDTHNFGDGNLDAAAIEEALGYLGEALE